MYPSTKRTLMVVYTVGYPSTQRTLIVVYTLGYPSTKRTRVFFSFMCGSVLGTHCTVERAPFSPSVSLYLTQKLILSKVEK